MARAEVHVKLTELEPVKEMLEAAAARVKELEAELDRMRHPAYVPPHLAEHVRLARWAQQLHADVRAALFLLEQKPPSAAAYGLIDGIRMHLAEIEAETQEGTDG